MRVRRKCPGWGVLWLSWTMLWTVSPAAAQYDEPRSYTSIQARFLAAGVLHRDFAPRDGNPVPDSLAIRFKAYMPVLSYHHGPFEIGFGYTRYTLLGSTRASVYFGAIMTNEFPLAMSRTHALVAPLCVAADFTKAEGGGVERDNFNIASLGLGTGLRYRYMSSTVDAGIRLLAIIHYSFEGLSTGSGSSASFLADAGLILRSIHIGDGLALGYRYRYQHWSMSNALLNYRVASHGPYLGVLF